MRRYPLNTILQYKGCVASTESEVSGVSGLGWGRGT